MAKLPGGNYLTGETNYSEESYCDYSFFVMKVDAVITTFERRRQFRFRRQGPHGIQAATRRT